MATFMIGDIRIDAIVESICTEFEPLAFFPGTTVADWNRHRSWMTPRALDARTGNLILTMQALLVRTRRHTLLIDACVGDHKPRPARPFWHMLRLDNFVPQLTAHGVAPEQVDYVMCTHLHWDHVGWNTRLRDGRWVPTFPNARYIFGEVEWRAWQALHAKEAQAHVVDSILPVIEAQQAEFVAMDFALDDEVWLEPTPGHTPGHVSIHLASRGVHAVIAGDCMHSPVQCLEPHWAMRADFDSVRAVATRKAFLDRYCDSAALVCVPHFPLPSAGRIVRRADAFWFDDRRSPA